MTDKKTLSENKDNMLDIILDLTDVTPRPDLTDKQVILAICRAIYNIQDYIIGRDK